MGTRYLIDTCAVIKYLQETFSEKALLFLDEVLDNESQISFITQIELLSWKSIKSNSQLILEQYIKGSRIFYVNNPIIYSAIEIRKSTGVKLPDAIIAATALTNDFTLISDNDKDFLKLEKFGLSYMNSKNL